MSTCISLHGEYSEHVLPGTKFSEFDCDRCYAFAEDAALAEVERLRAKVARVAALAEEWIDEAGAELQAALAEPERDEEGGNV